MTTSLVHHECKEEGAIMIEAGKPCSWCGVVEPFHSPLETIPPLAKTWNSLHSFQNEMVVAYEDYDKLRMYAMVTEARLNQIKQDLGMTRAQAELMAGDLSAQEWRKVSAILTALRWKL